MTEISLPKGPNRRRKRLLINNDDFYRHYPYRPELDSVKASKKYKIPSSFDSKEYFQTFRVKSLLHFYQQQSSPLNETVSISLNISTDAADQQQQELTLDSVKDITSAKKLRKDHLSENNSVFVSISEEKSPCSIDQNESTSETTATTTVTTAPLSTYSRQNTQLSSSMNSSSSSSNNQNIARLLEDGEKINHIYRCARVQGLDTTEGVFLFGKEHLYILDGFTQMSNKDIVDIDSLRPSAYEPLIPKSSCGSGSTAVLSSSFSSTSSATFSSLSTAERTFSKFAYEDIREVHNRRYLLQEIAMEIFANDGRNYLLVFQRKCRNKVYERLIALTPDLNDSASQSIAGQRRSTNIEQNTSILNALIGEKSVVQRWERGEITNFQYLMFLNTLAGRSYNDLMQCKTKLYSFR